MKKILSILLALSMVLAFAGCEKKGNTEEEATRYSLSGTHEDFSVNGGSISISEDTLDLDAGNFEATAPFLDICAYTMKVYVDSGTEQNILLCNSVEDTSGGTLKLNGDIGKIAGHRSGRQAFSEEDIEKNLYFELTVRNLSDETKSYVVKLDVQKAGA